MFVFEKERKLPITFELVPKHKLKFLLAFHDEKPDQK